MDRVGLGIGWFQLCSLQFFGLQKCELVFLAYYYKCQDYSDTIAKKCCRGTVQNVMSKFAVNAVQQIDSAVISDLQRMP